MTRALFTVGTVLWCLLPHLDLEVRQRGSTTTKYVKSNFTFNETTPVGEFSDFDICNARTDSDATPLRRRRVKRTPTERAAESETPPSAVRTAEGAATRPAELVPDPADTRIVQFTQALSAQDITRLREQYGLALTVYMPNFAYVERVPPRMLRREPLVRAIVPYLPEFKISASIADPLDPALRTWRPVKSCPARCCSTAVRSTGFVQNSTQ